MAALKDTKYFKVPLDGTPSLLNNNLSSLCTLCKGSGEETKASSAADSSASSQVLLSYSSGNCLHWLYTKESNLVADLGESVKENRYESMKSPGDEEGQSTPSSATDEQGGAACVIEEHVDKTWNKATIESGIKSPSIGSKAKGNVGGQGHLRLRSSKLHRISSSYTAIVACVSNISLFEVEIYLVEQSQDAFNYKCSLQLAFSPSKTDPTTSWMSSNSKSSMPLACSTQGSTVVYCFPPGKPAEASLFQGTRDPVDVLDPHVCVGCSSGNTFVFETTRPPLASQSSSSSPSSSRCEFNHIATLTSSTSGSGSGSGSNPSSSMMVSCLCSMEEMHLRYPKLSCMWCNLLFVGHEDGTIVVFALGEDKASIAWKTNLVYYLDSFDKDDDTLVSMRLLASTGQLVLATLSGHLVVIKFEALEEETKGNVAEDSVHLLKLSSSNHLSAEKLACVSNVSISRVHPAWMTGIDVTLSKGRSDEHLIATCAQDGSIHVFRLPSDPVDDNPLECLFSHLNQFSQYTGIAFLESGSGSASVKLAASAYEDSDVTVFHVDL